MICCNRYKKKEYIFLICWEPLTLSKLWWPTNGCKPYIVPIHLYLLTNFDLFSCFLIAIFMKDKYICIFIYLYRNTFRREMLNAGIQDKSIDVLWIRNSKWDWWHQVSISRRNNHSYSCKFIEIIYTILCIVMYIKKCIINTIFRRVHSEITSLLDILNTSLEDRGRYHNIFPELSFEINRKLKITCYLLLLSLCLASYLMR